MDFANIFDKKNLKDSEDAPIIDLEHLYRVAPFGLCVLDRELRYVHVNDWLAAANGKPVDEHLGKSIHEIIPDISQKIASLCQKVMETGEPILTTELERTTPGQNGKLKCFLESYFPLKGGNDWNEKVGIFVLDITEHKQNKRELTPFDYSLHHFMDQSPALIFMKDERLRHIYGNATLLKTFGVTLSQFIGTQSGDLFPPELARELERVDEDLLTGRIQSSTAYINLEIEGKRKYFQDVKFLVLNGAGEKRIAGVALDITERVQAEKAIDEQLEFEKIISDIAALLASVKPKQMEEVINSTLEILGQFLKTERAFLGKFSEDQQNFFFTNVWAAKGLDPASKVFEINISERIPQLSEFWKKGGTIVSGPGLSGLPEIEGLRSFLERDGISSGVVVPIMTEEKAIGAIGLDTMVQPHDYPQSIVDRLRMVADMIGATLSRIEVQTALYSSLNQIQALKEQIEQENIFLREEIRVQFSHDEIVGESSAIKQVLNQAEKVAKENTCVLIMGETGTGKELFARAIHRMSLRSKRAMIKVNCAALPSSLIESELFGREKGAYTGAISKELGRFEVANGSTIFLDEIGDMPIEVQAKLLRVLEEGSFERLGSSKSIAVDVRIIAATNHNLEKLVHEGKFRRDLYYRLNAFPITLPPIRERREDIPLFVWAFVKEFAKTMGKSIERIPQKTMALLQSRSWPGNVRELRNVIERAMILSSGPTLQIDHIETKNSISTMSMTIQEVEREHILKVLETTKWRVRGKNGAASILNLKPTTLETRMKMLGIQRPS